MYKTISIRTDTYQQLQTISVRLEQPKAQIIEYLIGNFTKAMHKSHKSDLNKFNSKMEKLINRITLPKGTHVDTSDTDRLFAGVKNIDI